MKARSGLPISELIFFAKVLACRKTRIGLNVFSYGIVRSGLGRHSPYLLSPRVGPNYLSLAHAQSWLAYRANLTSANGE